MLRFAAGLWLGSCLFVFAAHAAQPLQPGVPQAAWLGGDALEYSLDLRAGDAVWLEVIQHGADARVSVRAPDGIEIYAMDNLFNAHGPEWVEFTAPADGLHTLRLTLSHVAAPRGIIELQWRQLRDAAAAAQLAQLQARQDEQALEWMRAAAWPLDGDHPALPAADLQPLAKTLAEARLVGLGEAAHGSAAFARMKHRLLMQLVREHRFKAVMLEWSPAEVAVVDQWLQTGSGTLEAHMRGLGWVWRNAEMRDLFLALREHNLKHPRQPVRLYGVDTANPRSTLLAAAKLLSDDDEAADIAASLRAAQVGQELLQESAQKLLRVAGRCQPDCAEGRRYARAAAAALEVESLPEPQSAALRDQTLATQALTLLDQMGPGARAVFWAHNNHVARVAYGSQAAPPAGAHLARALGRDYLAAGLLFERGSLRSLDPLAQKLENFELPPAPESSLEGWLARVGLPVAAWDLRRLPRRSAATPAFERERSTRSIGAAYIADDAAAAYARLRPLQAFDLLIYIRNSQTPGALLMPEE